MRTLPRVALFDLDNTLFDRSSAFRAWSERFVATRSLDPSTVDWLVEIDDDGKATRTTVFSALRERLDLAESAAELEADYRRTYPGFFHPDDLVLDGLRALRANGWKLGVVTNGPSSQEDKIRGLGLDAVLHGWCISDVVGSEKPSLTIFQAAATLLDVPLAGYMVGDQLETDVLGGHQAGLRTIFVSHGRRLAPGDVRPDEIVGDIFEALVLLRALPALVESRAPRDDSPTGSISP